MIPCSKAQVTLRTVCTRLRRDRISVSNPCYFNKQKDSQNLQLLKSKLKLSKSLNT